VGGTPVLCEASGLDLQGQHNGEGVHAMPNVFHRFVSDESGVTAVEYALVAALIAVVLINVLATTGTRLKTTFSSVAASL
jgi:pilus assembly protein Flp/PilA